VEIVTTSACAVLFPGQGGYYGGALRSLQHEHPEVRAVFEEIDTAARPLLGRTPSIELLDGKVRSLDEWLEYSPELLQLAIYGTSVATYRVLRRFGVRADALVGHSLGEIAALVSAGGFSVSQGAEIVCHRSLALADADLPAGYMTALGADTPTAERLLGILGDEASAVAVENHAGQTIVSGPATTLDTVGELAGVLRISAVRLKSPYPFHSPMLEGAARQLADRIRHIRPAQLQTPVFSPIVGRWYAPEDDLTAILASHLVRRVRFADAIRDLRRNGAAVFVEGGAQDTLSRIVRSILDDSDVVTVAPLLPGTDEPQALRDAVGRLAEAGVADATAPPVADINALRRALLPHLETSDFERFWAVRGSRVLALVRDELSSLPQNGTSPAHRDAPQERAAHGNNRAAVLEELIGIYAEALEYPREVFEEDTDLEAELGVDSVKQTELLARVSDRYGLPPRPPEFRMAQYNTLGRIADLVRPADHDLDLAASA